MKMFRVAVISDKSYRGKHNTMYKAIVLAGSEEEALEKVNASLGHPLTEVYFGGHVKITETLSDVYTF